MVRADAWVLDARLTDGEVIGRRMVEMTLEVRPKDGSPFQVTRKFPVTSGRVEIGSRLKVAYDPIDPEKVRLV
jgi:hypothetical protein